MITVAWKATKQISAAMPEVTRKNVVGKIKDDLSIKAGALYFDDSSLYDKLPKTGRDTK